MSGARNEVIIYKSDDGNAAISVRVENETVRLTIDQLSDLFSKSRSTINEHILNIFKEKELLEEDSVRKIGNSDFSTKPTNFYNLDAIIAVGYRVNSKRATQFRIWATNILKVRCQHCEKLSGLKRVRSITIKSGIYKHG